MLNENTIKMHNVRFWEEGDDDPIVDPDPGPEPKFYTEDEFNKAVARRQAALKAKREVEDKLKEMQEKLAVMPNMDEFETMKQKHAEMMQAYKELKSQKEEAELKSIEDEKERERIKLQREFEKEKEKMLSEQRKLQEQIDLQKSKHELYERNMAQYRKKALEGAIAATASTKAYNPQQIVRLTADDFVYDEKEERWVREVYDRQGKLVDLLGIEEHINAFLDDPINENLLKVGVKSGSDTPRNQRQRDVDDQLPADQTPDDKMYAWASESGFSINKKSSAEDKAWLYKTYTRLHGLDKKK